MTSRSAARCLSWSRIALISRLRVFIRAGSKSLALVSISDSFSASSSLKKLVGDRPRQSGHALAATQKRS